MNTRSAVQLVAEIIDAGGALTVSDGQLSYRLPPGLNTLDTLAALRDHKAEIVAGLSDSIMEPMGGYDPPGRYLTPPMCLTPRACCRLGPCAVYQPGGLCDAVPPSCRSPHYCRVYHWCQPAECRYCGRVLIDHDEKGAA